MPDIEYPDLPDTWEWWSGNRGAAYYTRWFGTRHAETATRVSSHRTVYRLILSRSSPFLLFEKMAISMSLRFLKQTKRTVLKRLLWLRYRNSSEN